MQSRRRSTLAICGAIHAVQDGLGATLFVLAPVLAQAFGLSYAEVGLIRATKSAATSVFELPSGFLAERFGERRLLVVGLACAGGGYACVAIAEGLGIILASLFLAGVGAAFQHALSSSVISRAFGEDGRRSALGLYNSSGDAGKLVFAGLFSLLLGMGIAWQGIVAAFGLVAVLLSLLVLFAMKRLHVGGPNLSEGEAEPGQPTPGWGVQDRWGFGGLCSAVFLDTAVQSGFLVFLAFMVAEKDVPSEWAAFAVVLTLIGGIFGKAGCGYLAERHGPKTSFVLTQCATAAGIVALTVSTPLWAFLLLPILGMFLQGSTTITYGAVSDFMRSDRQSRGFGLVYTVSSVASVSGPIVFGLVSDASGLKAAMWAMALASLIAVAPLLRSRTVRTRPQRT